MKRSRTRPQAAPLTEAGMFEGLEVEDSREESKTNRRYNVMVGTITLLGHSLQVYIGGEFWIIRIYRASISY